MKILILCLPAIGDALMATPMLKLLKEKMPSAQIDVACMFDGAKYIFKKNTNVNKTYKLSLYNEDRFKGLLELLTLRRKKYDISILVFPSYRREYHLVQRLIGAKKRLSHKFKDGYFFELNFLNTNLINVDETEHNVINNLNLLKLLGIDWEKEITKGNIKYDLTLDKIDIEFGQKYINKIGWSKNLLIGIHPGSTLSSAAVLRRWPIERYADLAKYIIKKYNQKILIFIGPDEKNLGIKLFNLIGDKKNCLLLDNFKFSEAVGILSQIDLLICNDNGFGHLAVGLNKKIITLWASTNDTWSLPYNKGLVNLVKPNNFKSWYRYNLKRKIPKGVRGGMEDIKVEDVKKIVDVILIS